MKNIVFKILQWIAVIWGCLFAIVSFANGGIVSGILFLFMTFLLSPFNHFLLDRFPEKLKKKGIIIAASVFLFFAGVFGFPTTSVEETPNEATEETVQKSDLEESVAKNDETQKEEFKIDESVKDDVGAEKSLSDETNTDEKKSDEKTNEAKTETQQSADSKSSSSSAKTDTSLPNQPSDTASQGTNSATESKVIPDNTEAANSDSNIAATTGGGNNGNNFTTGTATQSGLYYIVNANNKKVHKSTCHRLPNNDNQIIFNSLEDVFNAGYNDPCGLCNPW